MTASPLHATTAGLPADLKAEIARSVASDFYRTAFAVVLLLLFIPLFIVLLIAKFFVDRARGAQRLAEEKSHEAEQYNLQRQITEARLQALQAQVEPHFLYNTLANVQALIEVDPPAAGVMVGHLIDYLRAALPKMRESQSTVAQEIELARAYLNILKMRMGSRLEFSIEVEPAAEAVPFPPLMVPSLVENAIKHGLEPQRDGGRVDISARLERGCIHVRVVDTGRGLPTVTSADGGVGLANIRERLLGLYGSRAAFSLADRAEGGVAAEISLPLAPPANRPHGTSMALALPAAGEPAAPDEPRSIAGRVSAFLGQAHGIWRRVIGTAFIALMLGLLGCMIAVGAAMLAGVVPVHFGDVELHGVGGMAIGLLGLLAAFGIAALAMAVVVGVLYGVGLLLAGLLFVVPAVALIGLTPAFAPVLLLGILIYWLLRRRDRAAVTGKA